MNILPNQRFWVWTKDENSTRNKADRV